MVAKNRVAFEEALNMTGFGKFNFLAVLVNVGLVMGMAFEIMSVAYLVPASACELDTTISQQGIMASVPLMGIIATSHFWGYLADTQGRRKILACCMFLAFITGASSALSPNWIVFSFLKFLSSSAVAGTYALTVTLLSECTPQNRRSTLVALTSTIYLTSTGIMAIVKMHFRIPLGCIPERRRYTTEWICASNRPNAGIPTNDRLKAFLSIMGNQGLSMVSHSMSVLCIPILKLTFSYFIPHLNIEFTPWRLLNIIFAAPCAIGALAVYFTFESPRYLLVVGKEDQALEVLKGMFVLNTGKTAEDYGVISVVLGEDTGKATKGIWSSLISQTVPLLKPPHLKNTVLLSVLFIIVYVGLNPFIVWLPYIADGIMKALEQGADNLRFCEMLSAAHNSTDHVAEHNNCALNNVAMITVFVISVMIAALNVVVSTVINYVGRKQMLVSLQLVSGIAGVCVGLPNSWIISTICLIIFIAGILNFGMLSTFSVDIFPTYVKAMAVCVTLMIGRGSSVLGINLVKTMLVTDCELAFYSFGGLTFVGGLLAFFLPSENKLKKGTISS